MKMKHDSARSGLLLGLSASVCASLFFSGAAHAESNNARGFQNFMRRGPDGQFMANRRNQSSLRMRTIDRSAAFREARADHGELQRIDRATARPREINRDPQMRSLTNRMSREIGLPGQVPEFQTSNPSLSSYINYHGDEKHLSKGFSLDLSSTEANVIVGSNLLDGQTVTIEVGSGIKQVRAGSLLTPAEFAALNQKLLDGNQALTLNNQGAATGGALNLNLISADGKTIKASGLVIPESVAVVGDFARAAEGVRVKNDLVNSGSVYVVSSDSKKNTAIIAAKNITNNAGGLITTNASLAAGLETNELNLVLRAYDDISNSGEISSSGDLELTAGGSIKNTGYVGARRDLMLNTANLTNSGSIGSSDGNVSISAPIDMHLVIENTGGEIRALNGDINIATNALLNTKLNTNLNGGDWLSRHLNISSSDGTADAIVREVTGVVNVKAGATHFHADTKDLLLGDMQLTGDPAFSNSGNLVLTGLSLVTSGAPLALVAGGNITAGTATEIDTSNGAGAGGTLLIAAGADFTIVGNNLIITGGLASGGNVDLTGVTTITTTGTTNGGDIQIVAYNPLFNTNNGNITIPAATTITTGGGGAGTNGHVTIISESSTSGIVMGGIDTRGGTGGGGSINIDAHQIDINTGSVVIDNTTGATISGNFVPDRGLGSDVPISVGDLHTVGASIFVTGSVGFLQTNATVSTGNLDTGSNPGNTTVLVQGRSGITVDGFISAHGITLLSLGPVDLENLSSVNVVTDNSGNGGSFDLVSDVLIRTAELELNAVGTAGGRGGFINVELGVFFGTTSVTTVGGTGSNLKFDAHGGTDGGTVKILSSGPIVVNPGGIDAAGSNGSGAQFQLSSFDSLTLNDISFLSQADATGNNGNGGGIKLSGTAGGIIYPNSLASPLALSANGIGTGNGGEILFQARLESTPLFVGAPVKTPKTAANFITTSAKSGLLGGHGGSITVRNGATITVDTDAFDASPQSNVGTWNGASYNLDGLFGSGASSIIIDGSLNASGINGGNGGVVDLTSNNTKAAFSLNAGKVPKNGISGTISAAGAGGSITILNEGGGIKVLSPQAVAAPTISLSATGTATTKKAKISAKKTTLTASNSLSLTGHNGLGKLIVSAPTFALNSNQGKVSATNVLTTPVTLLNSFGGAGFTLTTSGPTTLRNIGTNAGAINVTGGNGGLLQVAAGSNIEAKESSLTLSNPDVTLGSILIGANATVQTSGVKGGNTVIAIGKPSGKGINPFDGTNPPNMNVTETGGTVFFGVDPAGVVATGATAADIIAKKANVIFNNGSTNTAANKITLASGVDVIADPPDRVTSSPPAVIVWF